MPLTNPGTHFPDAFQAVEAKMAGLDLEQPTVPGLTQADVNALLSTTAHAIQLVVHTFTPFVVAALPEEDRLLPGGVAPVTKQDQVTAI